ncbi:uncharacterized protein LOC115965646 isoform X2 [Quercus lobata]|uniref:uncharacterized protein LOC115965646 isoform X2 n=1 Tax=Quercus lobata TaxID=97700 RepID=UPI0012449C94|nr:uncharacterized protein LOC115965646 isoform X2 [Quercus lobata]
MAKPLFLPITPILLLACLCRSHGLRFVYMYQQYMRRRRRKRHHCGFAGGIQALRAHVAELLILPKNLKRKDFERFNQHDDELEDDVRIMSRSLFHRPNITRGLINAKLVSLQSKVLQTHTDEVWFLEFSHNWKCLVHHQKINQQLYGSDIGMLY